MAPLFVLQMLDRSNAGRIGLLAKLLEYNEENYKKKNHFHRNMSTVMWSQNTVSASQK